jgi:hypothetical protein
VHIVTSNENKLSIALEGTKLKPMSNLSAEEFAKLFSHTESLVNHIHWVKHSFSLTPTKDHLLTAINYSDIKERKQDFLREIVNTITSWVYSREKVTKLMQEKLIEVSGDVANASSFLTTLAFSKFRPGNIQGQFGELLLFNFVQHFFRAVPLLRKQPITTSTGHERFGADAIHFKKFGETNQIILGESKCYISKYQFSTAFETSLRSILSSFENLDSELHLYTYDDFIDPVLESIAKEYKAGKLKNVHFELVCLIAYNETDKKIGKSESEIKEAIITAVKRRCSALEDKIFKSVEEHHLDRINYIFFPIWELDKLLEEFQIIIGADK